MAHRLLRGLQGAVKNLVVYQQPKPINHFLKSSTRNYISEYMHKSAVEGNIARFIRNEIQYELDHSPPIEVFLHLFCFHKQYFFSPLFCFGWQFGGLIQRWISGMGQPPFGFCRFSFALYVSFFLSFYLGI